MNKALSISVIMPVLNAQRTLKECLASIRNQEYPQELVEIILVDGGSCDSTLSIARKFNAIIIEYPSLRDNQEARKGIGLQKASNELAAFIDSDNILPHRGWLTAMVLPLIENQDVVATQPLLYAYDKKYSLLNRYFALFGVNDPVAYYFNKRDRLSWAENRWNLFGDSIDKGAYYLVKFNKDKLPTLGANGFLARKDILRKARVSPDEFFHIDINYDMVSLGYDTYGIIKDKIIHLSADTFFSFLRKRLRFMKYYHQRDYGLRRYRVYEPKDKFKLCIFVVISLTFVKPIYDSLRGFARVHDLAWFLHPLMCFALLVVYGIATIESLIFKFILK